MSTSVTDDATTQSARNTGTELQSAPTKGCKFVQQTRPTDTRSSGEQSSAITTIFNGISAHSNTSHNATYTCISIQNIRPIASNQKRPALLCTTGHQIQQILTS